MRSTRRGAARFLVTVADAQGLSYYGNASLMQRLHLGAEALAAARGQLIGLELIAYQAPLYQVLAIAGTQAATRQAPRVSATPPASERARATNAGPVSLAQLIELERLHARL